MPLFIPWPWDGEQTWAASPARSTRPARNVVATFVWQWNRAAFATSFRITSGW